MSEDIKYIKDKNEAIRFSKKASESVGEFIAFSFVVIFLSILGFLVFGNYINDKKVPKLKKHY